MSVMDVLNIGNTALIAQRAALEVTGENIANVNTPGYSRQSSILETAPASPDQIGNGVRLVSVQRAYDQFLQVQINIQNSANGEQTTEHTALQRVQPFFNDLAGSGLGKSLQDFFNAWQDLAMNPQGEAERQSVLAKAQSLTENFHQINNSLNAVKQDADQSLTALASEVNGKSQQIAALNARIRTAEQTGGTTNQLRDSRDQLLQDLARKVGINTLQQSDGTVSASLVGGAILVDGEQSAILTPQGKSVLLSHLGGKSGTGNDVAFLLSAAEGRAGELGGALQVRDTLINGFLANLDELADTLAVQVNAVHATGYGLDGSTGVDFFTPPSAPVPPATFSAGFSSVIGLNIGSSSAIAAASADPTQTGNGSGNNIRALAIADLQNEMLAMSGGSNTLSGFYSSLVGKVGLGVESSNQDLAQTNAMLKQLNTIRDSISGVSLDEELTSLIKYQKAFQGAAQLINTGKQMVDVVLDMVR